MHLSSCFVHVVHFFWQDTKESMVSAPEKSYDREMEIETRHGRFLRED